MNTLIIGSSSVIGAAIAEELKQIGDVLTAGRRNADFFLDLLDFNSTQVVDGQIDIDTVILVAADFGGPSITDFVRATQVNVLGAINSVAIASQVGAKHFILVSSISACYTPVEKYYNSYALTKSQAEQSATLACAMHGIDLTIVRPSAVFDTRGECRKHQSLLYSILDSAREGRDFSISGSADPLRNYVHVEDVALLVAQLVSNRTAGTFICAQPDSLSISALAQIAYSVFGKGGSVHFDPSKPDIATSRPLLDGSEGDMIWKPHISVEDGMHRIRLYGEGNI